MAKRKEKEHGQDMEARILASAEKLFFSRGYSATSTTQIAAEAGCNQALVHYYFRTKDKLFNAVLTGKVKKVFRQFLVLETGEGNFEEKLTRLIGLHYDTVKENSNMVLFLMTELTRNPQLFEGVIDEVGDLPARSLALFKKELEAEIAAHRIRPVGLEDLIINIISLNVFLFAVKPVFQRAWNIGDKNMEAFLEGRKKEIINTILLSLRP